MSLLSRLWALRDDRPLFVAVSVVALAYFAAWPFLDWTLRSIGVAPSFTYWDWGALSGGVVHWYAGEVVYRSGEWGYHGSYLYPPVYLLLFAPFVELQQVDALTLLPFASGGFQVGATLWLLCSMLLLWIGLQSAVTALGCRLDPSDRFLLLWPLLGFQPLLYSVKMGQTSVFLAGVLCLAFVAHERGRRPQDEGEAASDQGAGRGDAARRASRFASGALTVLASAMKPFYAVSGAHLLRDRDRLLGAVGAFVALAAFSLAVFGPDLHAAFVEVLRWGKGWGGVPNPPWLWHAGYYQPFYSVADLTPTLPLVLRGFGAVGIVVLSLAARETGADRETFALGIAAIPLLAPQPTTLSFVVLLPAAVVLLALEFERGRQGRPWLPVLALWLVNVHAYGLKLIVNHLPAWLPFQDVLVQASPVLQAGAWGNLILVGLAAYRVAEHVPAVHVWELAHRRAQRE